MFIYAMINMNIVSWGTREVANADDVEVDVANRVKQPNIWTSFVHEVAYYLLAVAVGRLSARKRSRCVSHAVNACVYVVMRVV